MGADSGSAAGASRDGGVTARDNRLLVEAVCTAIAQDRPGGIDRSGLGIGRTYTVDLAAERDKTLYKVRHLIENFFCKIKLFRAITTRYDKTARNVLAAIHLPLP